MDLFGHSADGFPGVVWKRRMRRPRGRGVYLVLGEVERGRAHNQVRLWSTE